MLQKAHVDSQSHAATLKTAVRCTITRQKGTHCVVRGTWAWAQVKNITKQRKRRPTELCQADMSLNSSGKCEIFVFDFQSTVKRGDLCRALHFKSRIALCRAGQHFKNINTGGNLRGGRVFWRCSNLSGY